MLMLRFVAIVCFCFACKPRQDLTQVSATDSVGLCQQLAAWDIFAKVDGPLAGEYVYLCENNGFKSVTQSNGDIVTIENSNVNGKSTIWLAAQKTVNFGPEEFYNLQDLFCQQFSRYQALMPEAAMAHVKKIEISNRQTNECDFHYLGQKTAGVQPEFMAHSRLMMSASKKLVVNGSYLTRAIQTPKASRDLSIVYQDEGGTHLLILSYNHAVLKKLLHPIAVVSLKAGLSKSMESVETAVNNLRAE